MAVEPLAESLRDAGFAMRSQLDAVGLRPQGLMWLHFPHVRDWRLTVMTDLLDELGRTRIYGLLGDALDRVGPIEGLTIFDVHLASPKELVPAAVERVFDIELGDAPVAVVLQDCKADGQPVDAVVYRMTKARAPAEIRRAAKDFTRSAKAFANSH